VSQLYTAVLAMQLLYLSTFALQKNLALEIYNNFSKETISEILETLENLFKFRSVKANKLHSFKTCDRPQNYLS
jgi:uncharacterized protein with ParB-like and HNH nuclease domain